MRSVLKSLAIVVGIPTLVSILYFGFLASDVFVSVARFSIRSSDGSSGAITGLAALLTTPGASGTGQETSVVKDYIYSADMLDKLSKQVQFEANYTNSEIDWLARLNDSSTREETLEYYQKQVDILRDTSSDVVTLKARAFTPEMAHAMAQEIIGQSEDLVNRLSARIESDALQSAHEEIERASGKVTDVGLRLSKFRNVNSSVDPAEEGSAVMGLLSGIEGKIVEVRTELDEIQAYMRDSAPEVVTLKNKLNALQKQRRIEKNRLIGESEDNDELSDLMEEYRPLVIEQELAQQQYASALASAEVARAEASRKKQYLITFIEPSLPDEAVEPRRLKMILTVFVFSFIFYSIGGLMWSALKDHVGR